MRVENPVPGPDGEFLRTNMERAVSSSENSGPGDDSPTAGSLFPRQRQSHLPGIFISMNIRSVDNPQSSDIGSAALKLGERIV